MRDAGCAFGEAARQIEDDLRREGLVTVADDGGDSGHSREREQHFECDRKLAGEHGFDSRGTDESCD